MKKPKRGRPPLAVGEKKAAMTACAKSRAAVPSPADLHEEPPLGPLLELAPRYWLQTRARLVVAELECELGWLTVPEPPLAVANPVPTPTELALAP